MVKIFIDNFYENATPLDWNFDGKISAFMPLADHEAFSNNYQVSQWNFRLQVAKNSIGQTTTLGLISTYCNGNKNKAFSSDNLSTVVSRDQGKIWSAIAMAKSQIAGCSNEFQLTLDAPKFKLRI